MRWRGEAVGAERRGRAEKRGGEVAKQRELGRRRRRRRQGRYAKAAEMGGGNPVGVGLIEIENSPTDYRRTRPSVILKKKIKLPTDRDPSVTSSSAIPSVFRRNLQPDHLPSGTIVPSENPLVVSDHFSCSKYA